MRAAFRRAGAAFAATGAVLLACIACSSGAAGPVNVTVGPTVLVPRDVLQNATSLSITVYDEGTGLTCDTPTGRTVGVTPTTQAVTSAMLGSCPTTSSAKFCGTLTLTESSATLAFAASALDATGATVAYGCTSSVVNDPAASVSISMIRNAPTASCGDGAIEPGEQCDPPPPAGTTDPVCDSACNSQEEVLSAGTSTPRGPAFLLWPTGTGQSGELLAFFSDAAAGDGRGANVALRLMDADLEPLASPAALASAILAPNDATSTLPPSPAPGNQSQPSAAFVLGTYFYVFADDAFGPTSIHMRSFDATLTGQQAQAAPIVLDGPPPPTGSGDAGSDGGSEGGTPAPDAEGGGVTSAAPSVALNGSGSLFVAWQDTSGPSAGQILGRTYTPTGASLGPITTISATTTTNESVEIAGTATGWVAVWDDTTEIKMRVFSGNGTPNGAEIVVSDGSHAGVQDHPAIAVLADGRLAVVWADHGTSEGADVFVQRYDANFVPVAGDQAAPINDLVGAGDQITPAIAGTTASGGSFIAAWIDSTSGDVRGRVLDGSKGFDFNPIDGTTDEFRASVATAQQRENPVVAIGGEGPWAAIGWDVGGVVSVRRFPTSTQSTP